MYRNVKAVLITATVASSLVLAAIAAEPESTGVAGAEPESSKGSVQPAEVPLPSVEEARSRARLLHETVHATLQIVHDQYYREDEGLPIPAFTLKDVFQEVADRSKVELRWLAVDGQAMNIDHKPQNAFEKAAAKALAAGEQHYEATEEGIFRYVGRIRLHNDCLKCHLPHRTSTEDRTAGLIITLPAKAN